MKNAGSYNIGGNNFSFEPRCTGIPFIDVFEEMEITFY